MASPERAKPTQFILLTIPRSACHLLDRMLSKQSNAKYISHPYIECMEPRLQWINSEDRLDGMSEELAAKEETERKKALEAWKAALKDAESEGKTLMNHTHPIHCISQDIIRSHLASPEKPLVLQPDVEIIPEASQLLLHPGTVPVFTIRDPRLVVASGSRLLRPMGFEKIHTPMLSSVSPVWSRTMYDWFVANGIQPIVVDADDYMTSGESVKKLCREAGLNENEAFLKWEEGTKNDGLTDKLQHFWDYMQNTLQASSGTNPGRAAKNMDMDALVKGWKDEFGEEAQKDMMEAVKLHKPHYDYLYERRLRS